MTKSKQASYVKAAKCAGGPPIAVPEGLLSADSERLRRFLEVLMRAVLSRRILARQASCVRGIIETSLRMSEVELLEELERRIGELEAQRPLSGPVVQIERVPLREELKREGERLMSDPELRRAEGLDS
jgi:hypothetical protein